MFNTISATVTDVAGDKTEITGMGASDLRGKIITFSRSHGVLVKVEWWGRGNVELVGTVYEATRIDGQRMGSLHFANAIEFVSA